MWTKLYPEEGASSAYVTRLKNEQASKTLGKLGISVSDTDFAEEEEAQQEDRSCIIDGNYISN